MRENAFNSDKFSENADHARHSYKPVAKTELKGMVLNYGIDVYHQWKDSSSRRDRFG